jgi:hypothetical protein
MGRMVIPGIPQQVKKWALSLFFKRQSQRHG